MREILGVLKNIGENKKSDSSNQRFMVRITIVLFPYNKYNILRLYDGFGFIIAVIS